MMSGDSGRDEITSMIRRKIQTRFALARGLTPLLATTLVMCFLILMRLVSTNGRVAACPSEVLKTPAIYLEHIGDEDKPIYPPIVIAASRPTEQELGCAIVGTEWRSAGVFLVREDELPHANVLVKGSTSLSGETPQPREFRYVLVSKLGTVESGILIWTQSHAALTALAAYFDGRQPDLHEHLTSRWF
jgi:hypothetical protein